MRKKKRSKSEFPIIGKYIDTSTKAELGVVYFMDGFGEYKLSTNNLTNVIVKGCRFQVKLSEIKRKRKFSRKIQSYLDFSSGWKELERPEAYKMPLLFGLIKLRKKKERKFILVESADCFMNAKVINIHAAIVDNLLYLELVNKLKTQS